MSSTTNGKDPKSNVEAEKSDSKKRPADGNNSPVKRKKKFEVSYRQPKNAVTQLNEIKPGLKYIVECEGDVGSKSGFVISVEVNGDKYFGKGQSKQSAKHAAAEAALRSFIQFPNMPDVIQFINRENVVIDFTKDEMEVESSIFDRYQQEKTQKKIALIEEDSSLWQQQKINNKLRKLIAEADRKNPVMLLNELRHGLNYYIVPEDTGSVDAKFAAEVNVDGNIFCGVGQSKKAAKAAAAKAVLSQMFNFTFGISEGFNEADRIIFDVSQPFADNIGKCVQDALAAHTQTPPVLQTLAGIVMTKDEKMENMQAICFSTGAKFLTKENFNLQGEALNDCHAEVIARRCLKDFLFTQLELHFNGKGHESIFQKHGNKFILKPNVRFHFYVSSIPCGDAAMFTLHDNPKAAGLNLNNTDHGSGLLRSKLEFGTIPVGSASSEQNVNDIVHNKAKYQIMSCSDKMTLWNVLGAQGSLLSYFIDPIYFHTIVFGQSFHGYHVLNCMFKRIENTLKNVPPLFRLHKPKLAYTSISAAKFSVEVPRNNINWSCNQETCEVIVSTTGKPQKGTVSRLAKRSLFQRFCNLQNLLLRGSIQQQPRSYNAIKQGCTEYCTAKGVAMEAFYFSGLGRWKKKPIELDAFAITS